MDLGLAMIQAEASPQLAGWGSPFGPTFCQLPRDAIHSLVEHMELLPWITAASDAECRAPPDVAYRESLRSPELAQWRVLVFPVLRLWLCGSLIYRPSG